MDSGSINMVLGENGHFGKTQGSKFYSIPHTLETWRWALSVCAPQTKQCLHSWRPAVLRLILTLFCCELPWGLRIPRTHCCCEHVAWTVHYCGRLTNMYSHSPVFWDIVTAGSVHHVELQSGWGCASVLIIMMQYWDLNSRPSNCNPSYLCLPRAAGMQGVKL
jgi:hypothetical protein